MRRSAVFAGFLSLVIAAPAAGFAGYVTNSGDATVSVIETMTDEVVGSPIAVGAFPSGIAVRPQRDRVYVATGGGISGTVTVINTETKTAIATIPQTEGPEGVAVHPAGTSAYVANKAANAVGVIDTATNTALPDISVTFDAPGPTAVAATVAGLPPLVLVAGDFGLPPDSVAAIDGTDTVVDSITVGDGARAIALTADGTKAYVANFNDGTVSVLDVSTPSSMTLAAADITVGTGPSAIAIPATGNKAYVTNSGDDTVSIIDTTADTSNPLDDIALDPGSSPSAAAATPDSARVYVANEGANDISIIDTATDMRIGADADDIDVGTAPRGIVLFPPPGAPAPPPPAPPEGAPPPPPPILGEQANVDPISGKVKTKCKGDKSFGLLPIAEQIPIGCQVDTRDGRVELTSATGIGEETQTAVFWGGRFRVKQNGVDADAGSAAKEKPVSTVLSLVGSLRSSKSAARGAGEPNAEAAKKKRKKRKLWGKGKGKFKTKGKKGAGSVRGTTWLTEDRSDGSTRLKVKAGKVRFRDFTNKRTVKLTAGESYVAKKK